MEWSIGFIVLGLLCLAGEFFLPAGIIGIFGIGLLVAGVLIYYGVSFEVSIIAGAIASGAAAMVVWLYWRKLSKRPIRAGGESLVGLTAKVTQDFKNGKGLIDLKGEGWSARSKSEANYKVGDKVEITGFEGVYLGVK